MKIILEFTVEQLNIVLSGLSELPAKHSFDLINEIKVQADAELKRLEAIKE